MAKQETARNDRIVVRYMQGESGRALAREYRLSEGRVRQIIARHMHRTQRFYAEQFGQLPAELQARTTLRARLRHLFAQFQQATGGSAPCP